jgi:hypothetical protein
MMQSIEEHPDISKGEAAVMPVGEPRKWRRIRNVAAERRQKMKERTRGKPDTGGSRLPPAERSPAVQKWHEGK